MNFKTSAAYIVVLVSLLCGTLVWYGYTVIQQVTKIEDLWINFNHEATQASYDLSQINSNFGYGGFIHNFKNFILHQNDELIPIIDENLTLTYDAINDYKNLNISEEEIKALDKLAHIVDIYASKYTFAKRLVSEGNTPRQIEVHVQVNDKPALDAIDFLARFSVNRSMLKEKETDKALHSTIYFLNWGAISIPLIILVGIIIINFLKRLLDANIKIENAKKYSEELIESAPDAWLIIDKTGKIVRANTQAEKMFGYKREELESHTIELLIPERFRGGHGSLRDGYFKNPKFRPVDNRGRELLAVTKQGKEFPVEISLAYTHKDGEMQAVAATRDITKRKHVEERQRLTENVFKNAAEGIIILDYRLRILDTNDALSNLMGYSHEELIGHTPRILSFREASKPKFEEIRIALQQNGQWHGELWLKHKNSENLPVLISISEVRGEQEAHSHYVIIFSDITRQKQQEERLEQLAHYDSLTTLPNRMLFFDRFRGALARARRLQKQVGIFYIDLDGFKQINDTLGHESGDEVLIRAAEGLKHCIREDDTTARLGGDEFVILFNDLDDLQVVNMLAERIISNLSFSVPAGRNKLFITASIGISIYPRDGNNEELLLRNADNAMYQAKRKGKNNYYLHETINNS